MLSYLKSFLLKKFRVELKKYSCHPKTARFITLGINLKVPRIASDFDVGGAKLSGALDQKRAHTGTVCSFCFMLLRSRPLFWSADLKKLSPIQLDVLTNVDFLAERIKYQPY